MNRIKLIGLIILIGFLLIVALVVYQTDVKIKQYLEEHPDKVLVGVSSSSEFLQDLIFLNYSI